MGRTLQALTIVPAALTVFLTACASGKNPQPPIDPLKEQITILQKQLLELQNVQNEIRRMVDAQASSASELDARIKALEAHRAAAVPQPSAASSKQPAISKKAPTRAKKTVKEQPPKGTK
jgi:hypothetical protein